MNPLLVSEHGSHIQTYHTNLQINTPSGARQEFKPREMPHDLILIDSPWATITESATLWLAKHGVNVVHMSWNSKPYAQTIPIVEQSTGNLKIAQVKAHINPVIRLEIAKSIVRAKTRREIPSFVKTLNKLKGFEADVALEEFAHFARDVEKASKGKFKFTGRQTPNRKDNANANDEVNCMLSFGYSAILEPLVRKNLISVGLLPEVGYLHESGSGREPLVWDMMEGFRFPINEAVITTLPKVTKKSFLRNGDYLLRMKPQTIHQLIANIRTEFERKREYRGDFWKTESIVLDYARILAKSLTEGKIPEFSSF